MFSKMKIEKFFVKNRRGEKLAAVKVMPGEQTSENIPAVIRVHGFGSSKDADGIGFVVPLSKKLASAGIVTYYFDIAGCGESEGNYIDTTLSKQVHDFEDFLKYVRGDKMIDQKNVGVIGNSFGAAIVMVAKPDVQAVMLSGSSDDYMDDIIRLFGNDYHPDEISTRVKSDGKTITKIAPQFWTDLKKYNFIELIKKIHRPIFFLQGGKDTTCPTKNMENLFSAANEPKEKYIVKGADHKLNPCREEAVEVIVNWFQKKFS